MIDKEYKKQKARITYLRDKWVKQLGLNWYRITYEYVDESQSLALKVRYTNSFYASRPVFEVSSDGNYMEACITCYMPNVAELEDDVLEECFLHELMHIMVAPMRTKQHAGDEERVCTLLAKAFGWAVELVPKKVKELNKQSKISLKTRRKHVRKPRGRKSDQKH